MWFPDMGRAAQINEQAHKTGTCHAGPGCWQSLSMIQIQNSIQIHETQANSIKLKNGFRKSPLMALQDHARLSSQTPLVVICQQNAYLSQDYENPFTNNLVALIHWYTLLSCIITLLHLYTGMQMRIYLRLFRIVTKLESPMQKNIILQTKQEVSFAIIFYQL